MSDGESDAQQKRSIFFTLAMILCECHALREVARCFFQNQLGRWQGRRHGRLKMPHVRGCATKACGVSRSNRAAGPMSTRRIASVALKSTSFAP